MEVLELVEPMGILTDRRIFVTYLDLQGLFILRSSSKLLRSTK